MKLNEIVNTVKKMQGDFLKIQTLQKERNQIIYSIESEGRSLEWTATAIRDAKKKSNDELYKLAAGIKEDSDMLSKYAEFWTSPAFVLSKLSLSESKHSDKFNPENPTLEALSRLNLQNEAKLMNNDQLITEIKYASETGQGARLYLLAQEMHDRDPKSPGWQGIDLSTVNLKEQKEAVALFAMAKTIYNESIISIREVNNAPAESVAIQRLANAHELASK